MTFAVGGILLRVRDLHDGQPCPFSHGRAPALLALAGVQIARVHGQKFGLGNDRARNAYQLLLATGAGVI